MRVCKFFRVQIIRTRSIFFHSSLIIIIVACVKYRAPRYDVLYILPTVRILGRRTGRYIRV